MKTGLTKKQKVTEVYFDERDEIAEIHTHNTELKNGSPPMPRSTLNEAAEP